MISIIKPDATLRMSRTTPLIDFSTVSALWVVCRFSSTGHIQDLCRPPPEACVYYCVLMDFASHVGMANLEVLVRTGSEKFAIGVRFEAWQKAPRIYVFDGLAFGKGGA